MQCPLWVKSGHFLMSAFAKIRSALFRAAPGPSILRARLGKPKSDEWFPLKLGTSQLFPLSMTIGARDALGRLLRSLGHNASTFGSAEEFLESEKLHDTSCLITDLQMPGLNGLDLQDRLIAEGHRIPIIFITAHLTIAPVDFSVFPNFQHYWLKRKTANSESQPFLNPEQLVRWCCHHL